MSDFSKLKDMWSKVKDFHEEQQETKRKDNPTVDMDDAIVANVLKAKKQREGMSEEDSKSEAISEARELGKSKVAFDPEDMMMAGTTKLAGKLVRKMPEWAKKMPLNPGARGQFPAEKDQIDIFRRAADYVEEPTQIIRQPKDEYAGSMSLPPAANWEKDKSRMLELIQKLKSKVE
jgi:hypothetical protein